MNPITRKKGLTIKQMGDEAVIFDTESGAVHHLNRVAEMVWRSCDGRTDKEALARMVERVCNVPEEGEAVDLALEQLSRRGLMTIPIERADAVRRMNRRVVLKGLAKAMAIPAVLTITAGQARARTLSYCLYPCPGTNFVVDGVIVNGFCINSFPCPQPAVIVVVA